ncbi:DMT family transporter [Taklimakanibacter lacteus]|uniref:DMT family transporter n=1 Tax=Taklimakanibacter lacteus TaxID=2268456 RepID=UPI000E673862
MTGEIQDTSRKLAVLAGLAMVAITAVQFVAARFSLRADLTATDIATLRFLGAGIVFVPIVWRTGFGKLKALGWRRALALALLVGLPYPMIINWGLTYAPATHAAALCPASIVFFSFLLSRVFFREQVSPFQAIAIAVLIAGLLFFISPNGNNETDSLFGDLVFVGSGIMFSAYAILVRRWAVDSTMATAAVALISCLPLPFIYLFVPNGLDSAPTAEILIQIVVQGFLAGAAAIFLYTYTVRQLGPQMASLFLPCVPIATAFTGMIVLGEHPTLPQFLAIAVMTAAMIVLALLHQRGERWKARPEEAKLAAYTSSFEGD